MTLQNKATAFHEKSFFEYQIGNYVLAYVTIMGSESTYMKVGRTVQAFGECRERERDGSVRAAFSNSGEFNVLPHHNF
jgi:hypothetical protein